MSFSESSRQKRHNVIVMNTMNYARPRNEGTAILLVVIMSFVLIALVGAQFVIVQKNTQQSAYLANREELLHYAKSGARISTHALRYDKTEGSGKFGTLEWTIGSDLGSDGKAGTVDEGEGDGVPTPGEPRLVPVPIGPPELAGNLLVYVEDTEWPGVRKVTSIAYNNTATVSVQVYVQETTTVIPLSGPVYIEPTGILDLSGNGFVLDGNDTNPDGSGGTEGPKYGISAEPGSPSGDNATALLDQISSDVYDQITGLDGTASVGEHDEAIDILELFSTLAARKDADLPDGSYLSGTWGDSSDYQFTLVDGGLTLSGSTSGAGALLVDGTLTIDGSFDYQGLIIVLGDVLVTGSSADFTLHGSLLVTDSVTFADSPGTVGVASVTPPVGGKGKGKGKGAAVVLPDVAASAAQANAKGKGKGKGLGVANPAFPDTNAFSGSAEIFFSSSALTAVQDKLDKIVESLDEVHWTSK